MPALGGDVLQHGLHQRGVLPHIAALAALIHARRALEHGADIDAAYRRGEQAYGAHFAVAAAHAVGHDEVLKAIFAGQLDQVAAIRAGGGDDMLGPVVSHGLFQRVGEDQVLAHGFGGAAGLGDDVEAGGLYVDYVKQRGHALGVDVVLYIEAGAAALFGGQLVIVQVVQCLLHGDGAQRAAANAQHHKGVKLLAHLGGGLFDIGNHGFLIIGKLGPAQPALAAMRADVFIGLFGRVAQGSDFLLADAALAQGGGHHMVYIHTESGVPCTFCNLPFVNSSCSSDHTRTVYHIFALIA